MAFDTPTETWSSDLKKTLGEDGKTARQATRILQAVSDDPANDNEATAELVFPPLYSIHPRLGVGYVLRDVTVKRLSPILFEATCLYKTKAAQDDNGDDGTQGGQYPWDEPATVEFSTYTETGPTELDRNGDPIENTVGDPIPNVSADRSDQGIKITKNFLNYDPVAFYEFINTVNEDDFLGFPAGTLRVRDINGTPNRHDAGILYYTISVTILARKPIGDTTNSQAWEARVANQGLNLLDSAYASGRKPILKDGEPITTPTYINTAGTAEVNTQSGDSVHWLYFAVYKESKFSDMNLF